MISNDMLRRIRRYCQAMREDGLTLDEKFELGEMFEELDRYLMCGGPLPSDWAIHAHPSTVPLPASDDPWIDPNAPTHKPPF